jgi:hypothetical protein
MVEIKFPPGGAQEDLPLLERRLIASLLPMEKRFAVCVAQIRLAMHSWRAMFGNWRMSSATPA